jgi:basic membrane protein A and related proteins
MKPAHHLTMKLAALLLSLFAFTVHAEDKPALTVGVIYIGTVSDYGYNQAMKDGIEEMKKNVPGVKVIEAENVPETADAERIMAGMIDQGAKLIFATSFGHQQFAFNLAKTHPEVTFVHAGGWMVAPNFGNFFAATQNAWYVMGVAAGSTTKSNTLGFVVGVPIGFVIGNVNAFALGARSVNPKAEVRVVVTGGWADKAKEAAAANALIDQGADVLTMHVDSPATVIQIAESRGVSSIGFQSLQAAQIAKKGWITGLGFTWGPYMTEVAQQVIAGTFKGSMVRRGLGQKMMGVAPFGDSVPPAVRDVVSAAEKKVAEGYTPFVGPIKDNTGAVRIPAGETMGPAKMGDFDWYVEGVIGKAK